MPSFAMAKFFPALMMLALGGALAGNRAAAGPVNARTRSSQGSLTTAPLHHIRCPESVFPANSSCYWDGSRTVCLCDHTEQDMRMMVPSAADPATLVPSISDVQFVRCLTDAAQSSYTMLPTFQCKPTPPAPLPGRHPCVYSLDSLPIAIRMFHDSIIYNSSAVKVMLNDTFPSGTRLLIVACKAPKTINLKPVLRCRDGEWKLRRFGWPLCQACTLSRQDKADMDDAGLVAQSNASDYALGSRIQLSCRKNYVMEGNASVQCSKRPGDGMALFARFPSCRRQACDVYDIYRSGLMVVGHDPSQQDQYNVGEKLRVACHNDTMPINSSGQGHRNSLVVTCHPPHDNRALIGRFLLSSPNDAELNTLSTAAHTLRCTHA